MVGFYFLFNVLLLLLSHFSCVRLCATPQTAAHQAPPSLGFSRQEHWSGLPFPSPMHENDVSVFNMLSTFVIAFLPRSMLLLILWLHSPSIVTLEFRKIKFVTVSIVSHLFAMKWLMGVDAMILVFWMLSLKPAFSVSSLTFIKRLFSFSLLSAIRVGYKQRRQLTASAVHLAQELLANIWCSDDSASFAKETRALSWGGQWLAIRSWQWPTESSPQSWSS